MTRPKRVMPPPLHQCVILLLSWGSLFLLLISLAEFWGMEPEAPHLAAYALGATALGWFEWRWSAAGCLLVPLVPAAFCVADATARWQPLVQTLQRDLLNYWKSLRILGWEARFAPLLGEAFLLLTACTLASLFLREILGRGTAFRAAALGAVIFGIQWAWFFDRAADYFVPYLIAAFLLWAVGQAGRRQALWASAGRRMLDRPGIGAAGAAVVFVTAAAFLLPADSSPTSPEPLSQQLRSLFPGLTRPRGSAAPPEEHFTLNITGFNPNPDVLGGPVTLDDTLALILVAPELPDRTIYLRGSAFRIYNGQTWFPGSSGAEPVDGQASLPSHFAASVPLEVRTMEVRPALDFGRTLFSVLEPARVEGIDYLADSDGNLLAVPEAPGRVPYVVTARVPVYSSDQLRSLPAVSSDPALNPYLQLPASVPARVRNLARQITAEATHPYDKAVALEAWLRQFPYDLDVPAPPAGREFVDYFLFDLKRGYCTYFSTAMVVMLRELEIPARLVEGYAVSPAAGDPTPVGKGVALSVTNAMAHAWVEAYFPAYGWVTFDPTPRSDLPPVDRSAPAPSPAEATSAEGDPNSAAEPDRSGPAPASSPALSEKDHDRPDVAETPQMARRIPLLLLLPAAALLLATTLLRFRRRVLPGRADANVAVQRLWVDVERLLARFGAGRRPHETHREYAQALGRRWPYLRQQAAQMALDYERARYAAPDAGGPDPASVRRSRHFRRQVRRLLRLEHGWGPYLCRRLGLPCPRKQAMRKPPLGR